MLYCTSTIKKKRFYMCKLLEILIKMTYEQTMNEMHYKKTTQTRL